PLEELKPALLSALTMEIWATAESTIAKSDTTDNSLVPDARCLALGFPASTDPFYESPTTFASLLAPPIDAPQLRDETSLHASPDEYSRRRPPNPSQETNNKPGNAPSSAPCDSPPTTQSSIRDSRPADD